MDLTWLPVGRIGDLESHWSIILKKLCIDKSFDFDKYISEIWKALDQSQFLKYLVKTGHPLYKSQSMYPCLLVRPPNCLSVSSHCATTSTSMTLWFFNANWSVGRSHCAAASNFNDIIVVRCQVVGRSVIVCLRQTSTAWSWFDASWSGRSATVRLRQTSTT